MNLVNYCNVVGDYLKVYDKARENVIYEGVLVDVIKAGRLPNNKQLTDYYHVKPGDKDWHSVFRSAGTDRIIIKKDNGSYVIIPKHKRYIVEVV